MNAGAKALSLPGQPTYDIFQHIDHGWGYWSPTAFGLARIVDVSWPQEDLKDPEIYVDPTGDLTSDDLGWYFTRIAGDMAEVFSHLPFPLPHVAWHRHKGTEDVRIYRYHDLHSKLTKHRPQCGFHAIVRRGIQEDSKAPTAPGTASTSAGQRGS